MICPCNNVNFVFLVKKFTFINLLNVFSRLSVIVLLARYSNELQYVSRMLIFFSSKTLLALLIPKTDTFF